MQRRTLWWVVGGTTLVLAVAAFFVVPLFLPEESTRLDETLPEDGSVQVLKQGSWRGSAGHTVRGDLRLVQEADGLYLWFTDYEQTAGPDVYLYLTPSATPDTESEIDAGVRILLDRGNEGRSTLEGTFRQRLPDGLMAADFAGAGVWCDRFSVPFGYASLQEA